MGGIKFLESKGVWTLIFLPKLYPFTYLNVGSLWGIRWADDDQILDAKTRGMCVKNSRRRGCGVKVMGVRKDRWYPFFLTNNQRLVVGASSLSFVLVWIWVFFLFFVQELDKKFYISSIEIWCIDFRKKREEMDLLMISSIEIIIFLSSSSLRISWEKRISTIKIRSL